MDWDNGNSRCFQLGTMNITRPSTAAVTMRAGPPGFPKDGSIFALRPAGGFAVAIYS